MLILYADDRCTQHTHRITGSYSYIYGKCAVRALVLVWPKLLLSLITSQTRQLLWKMLEKVYVSCVLDCVHVHHFLRCVRHAIQNYHHRIAGNTIGPMCTFMWLPVIRRKRPPLPLPLPPPPPPSPHIVWTVNAVVALTTSETMQLYSVTLPNEYMMSKMSVSFKWEKKLFI